MITFSESVPNKVYNEKVKLSGTAVIEDGLFLEDVILLDNSKILNGSFYGKTELKGNSVIEGGMFFDSITLYDNSKILGGVFKVVIADKNWKPDSKTIDFIKSFNNTKIIFNSDQNYKSKNYKNFSFKF